MKLEAPPLVAPDPMPIVLTLVEAHVTSGYIPDPTVGARELAAVCLDLETTESLTLGLDLMDATTENHLPQRGSGGGGHG